MTPRRLGITVALCVVVVLAAVAVVFLRNDGIMPLDEVTLGRFQEANGRAMRSLLDASPGGSSPVQTATAFRMALTELGYDLDETLLYWLSPEFKQAVADGDPARAVVTLRRSGSLLASALGDGAGEEAFREILAGFSPELRAAAEQRRRGE